MCRFDKSEGTKYNKIKNAQKLYLTKLTSLTRTSECVSDLPMLFTSSVVRPVAFDQNCLGAITNCSCDYKLRAGNHYFKSPVQITISVVRNYFVCPTKILGPPSGPLSGWDHKVDHPCVGPVAEPLFRTNLRMPDH